MSRTGTPDISAEIRSEYEIVSLIGSGGMGDVYLAKQIGVGDRHVALKVLKHNTSADTRAVTRFKNEAASAGRIDNPHVVRIYECRTTFDGQTFIAMEYVEGTNLEDYIAEHSPIDPSEVAKIVRQVAAGLRSAHDKGIVHRDVKPTNIMLAKSGNTLAAKVVDFGIARLSDPDVVGTADGLVLGTAKYMSPEQAGGATNDKIDARADVYSLGMTAYEMLTGQTAFTAGSFQALLRMHIEQEPPPPSSVIASLPRSIDTVVLKSLAKNRDARHQTVVEFAEEFDRAVIVGSDRLEQQNLEENKVAMPQLGNPSVKRDSRFSKRVIRRTVSGILAASAAAVAVAVYKDAGSLVKRMVVEPTPTPAVKSSPLSPPKAASNVVSYQVILKDTLQPETLPADNSFRPMSPVRFRFLPSQDGKVYLLQEAEGGTLLWLNQVPVGKGGEPQPAREGIWSVAPVNDYIAFDGKSTEDLWVVFVPSASDWSLEKFVDPAKLEVGVKHGFSIIDRNAATQLLADLQKTARPMTSSGSVEQRVVTHHLEAKGDSNALAFYDFKLIPSAR